MSSGINEKIDSDNRFLISHLPLVLRQRVFPSPYTVELRPLYKPVLYSRNRHGKTLKHLLLSSRN